MIYHHINTIFIYNTKQQNNIFLKQKTIEKLQRELQSTTTDLNKMNVKIRESEV